ncbi:hypothetical protein [Bradyrhizobium sp. UFLA05-112]
MPSPRSLDIAFHGRVNFDLRANTDIEDNFVVSAAPRQLSTKPTAGVAATTQTVGVPRNAERSAKESLGGETRYAGAARVKSNHPHPSSHVGPAIAAPAATHAMGI